MPRYFPITLFLIATASRCPRDDLTPAAVAGCYEVVTGPWEAPNPLPANADSAHRPPRFLHLTDQPADTLWARGRLRVRAPGWRAPLSPALQSEEPKVRARYERGSSWGIKGDETVEIAWHTGYHGTLLRLHPTSRGTLQGVARVLLDFSPNPYTEATARVTAKRVDCAAAPPA